MPANDSTPSTGECVSEEPDVVRPAYEQLFRGQPDSFFDSAKRVTEAVERGDYDTAEEQLVHIQETAAALRRAIEDE